VTLPDQFIAKISYGKRFRVPEPILKALDLDVGDLVLFRIEDGKVFMFPGEVKIRGDPSDG